MLLALVVAIGTVAHPPAPIHDLPARYIAFGLVSALAIVVVGIVGFVSGLFAAVYWQQGRWIFLPWGALALLALSVLAWLEFFAGPVALLLFYNQH